MMGGQNLKIEKVEENFRPMEDDVVRVKEMGNVIEVMFQEKRNTVNVIVLELCYFRWY